MMRCAGLPGSSSASVYSMRLSPTTMRCGLSGTATWRPVISVTVFAWAENTPNHRESSSKMRELRMIEPKRGK